MPKRNLRGGKGFKKGRKTSAEEAERDRIAKFSGRTDGQDYARVLRPLGNRRVACFCNDGVERVCKIRGVLCWGPRRQKIEVGDIVLISLRDFEESDEDGAGGGGAGVAAHHSGRKDIADIITKIPHQCWRDVRREEGIHTNLFVTDGPVAAAQDDIFAEGSDDEDDNDEADGSDEEEEEERTRPSKAQKTKAKSKWSRGNVITHDGGGDEGDGDDGGRDIDIDAI